MRRLLSVLLGLVLLLTASVDAQRRRPRCTKGIPCGNTCIAATKTCRIGTTADPSPAPPPPSVQPALATSAAVAGAEAGEAIVGSVADKIYFRAGCSAARDLSPSNRVTFATVEAAERLGFRASQVAECLVQRRAMPAAIAETPAPPNAEPSASVDSTSWPWVGSRLMAEVWPNRRDCRIALVIGEQDRVHFRTLEAASAAGYRKGSGCR